MKEPIFTGAAVAIITPMNEDGTVNYDEFAKFVDWQLENGTDAIVICGTTGESSTLEVDEHIECIRWCINYVNGRCKVIAGTGSNSTASAIEMSKEAQMLFFLLHHIIIKQAKEVLSLIIKLFTMQPISLSSSIMFHQEQVLIFFQKLQRKSQSFQELTESKRQAEILIRLLKSTSFAAMNSISGAVMTIRLLMFLKEAEKVLSAYSPMFARRKHMILLPST